MMSHPRLKPPCSREVREALIPVYDEGTSSMRLLFISHELHQYLHRHEADEDENDFAEVFRALHVA